MIAAAIALLVATAPAACPTAYEARLQLGAGLSRKSVTGAVDVSWTGGATGAASLRECFGYPVRVEAGFFTSTLGGTAGVRAVKVSGWTGEVDLLAAYQWPWVVRETAQLGAELLLGPGFQLTSTSIDVEGQSTSHFGVEVLAAFGAGVFLESVGWRIGFRAMAGYPRERELRMLVGVGKIF